MKIRFDSDGNQLLDNMLVFHNGVIIIMFVFEEDGLFYPQIFLDETLYEEV